jgi:GTP-binding protein
VEDSESPPFGLKSSTVAVVNQPVVNTKTAATGTKTKSTNILGQNVVRCRDFSVNSAKTADFIGSYPSVDQMPIFSIPELAFLGRSNVGKSSLFNCLIGAKVAVCSKTPGRTQSLNTFTCKDKDGEIAVMVDLPGYGYAKLSKEKQDDISRFIENYLRERRSLRLVVLLVDCRREVQEYEAGVLRFLRDEGLQYILVATKIDKMGKNEAATAMGKYRRELQLEQDQLVGFSSLTSQGRKELWGKIRDGMIGTVSAAFAEEEKEGEGGVDGSGETLLEYDDDEVGWS